MTLQSTYKAKDNPETMGNSSTHRQTNSPNWQTNIGTLHHANASLLVTSHQEIPDYSFQIVPVEQ